MSEIRDAVRALLRTPGCGANLRSDRPSERRRCQRRILAALSILRYE
jgi:plasmid stabilization system protein ParE